jgi:FkbM family methyltransferase
MAKSMNNYQLPNGKEIHHINKYETEFLYKEIFVDKIYLKNNIKLSNDSIVFDIGANIGLFALFIEESFPGATIYMFEPSPQLCQIIRANTNNLNCDINIFEFGVSDVSKKANFTYYPGYSILSGFKVEKNENESLLRASVDNQLRASKPTMAQDHQRLLDILVNGKLDNPVNYECNLVSISEIIKENNVSRIDLLKIDAEKCEVDIINGIDADDWSKIKQIVVEVHDIEGSSLSYIDTKLKQQGFNVYIEQEENFELTGIYNLYGYRQQ